MKIEITQRDYNNFLWPLKIKTKVPQHNIPVRISWHAWHTWHSSKSRKHAGFLWFFKSLWLTTLEMRKEIGKIMAWNPSYLSQSCKSLIKLKSLINTTYILGYPAHLPDNHWPWHNCQTFKRRHSEKLGPQEARSKRFEYKLNPCKHNRVEWDTGKRRYISIAFKSIEVMYKTHANSIEWSEKQRNGSIIPSHSNPKEWWALR